MNESKTLRLSPGASFHAAPLPRAVLHSLVAAALGLVILWGVGFAENGALHETAHDTRHALGFPCH